jgi:hypothetical protein
MQRIIQGLLNLVKNSSWQLCQITSLARWFKKLAYGAATTSPTDLLSAHCRSSNLEQAKKAISYFMPNKHMAWGVRSNCGNPYESVPVNDCVNTVAPREARRLNIVKRCGCWRRGTTNFEVQSKYLSFNVEIPISHYSKD